MKMLFMCVANSARSQLAEGLAREIFPNAEVWSAGSQPGRLNPFAVMAMNEIGVDISRQHSKSVGDLPKDFVAKVDHVITLCAEEVCPVVLAPQARRHHWPFPDPATKEDLSQDQMLWRFREAREAIRARLLEFKQELNA